MRVTRRLAVVGLVVAALSSTGVAPAFAAPARAYGPTWGRFRVRFSSKPRVSGNLVKDFTYFGATNALGYAVTAAKKPFDASIPLGAPTFEVVAIDFGLKAEAQSALATARPRYAKPKRIAVAGAKGFESVTGVNGAPITTKKGARPRARIDRLGVLMVARGSTLFEVIADAANGAAVSGFLRSFSPLR